MVLSQRAISFEVLTFNRGLDKAGINILSKIKLLLNKLLLNRTRAE